MTAEPPPRILLISSCDRLADIACAGIFGTESSLRLVGVARTRMRAKTRRRIMATARREGAFFYIAYMFAEMSLPALRRGRSAESVLERASRSGAPIRESFGVNDPETIDWIRGLNADLVLSVRPGVIFKQPMIDAAPPILNLHCSRLPEFRGIAGVLQALAAGSEVLGCSVHLVPNEEIDRGPIAAQTSVPRADGRSVYYHTLQLYGRGPETLLDAARATLAGDPPSANEGGSYFSWPDRDTLRALHAQGHRMVEGRDLRL